VEVIGHMDQTLSMESLEERVEVAGLLPAPPEGDILDSASANSLMSDDAVYTIFDWYKENVRLSLRIQINARVRRMVAACRKPKSIDSRIRRILFYGARQRWTFSQVRELRGFITEISVREPRRSSL